jgi:hypothetical protein
VRRPLTTGQIRNEDELVDSGCFNGGLDEVDGGISINSKRLGYSPSVIPWVYSLC